MRASEANRLDQGPVLKTGGGAARLWVRVPPLPLSRSSPGTPTGRAVRLKPGRVWVRVPPWVLLLRSISKRLGRQPADHSRSEREMLRVRIPPEPLSEMEGIQNPQPPSRSSPECSPPCQGGDRGFKSHRGRSCDLINWQGTRAKVITARRASEGSDVDRLIGTVRKPAKRPSSNLGALWVRLPLVPLMKGWCSSRRPVSPLPSSCEAGGERFDSFTTHCVFGPVVYWLGRHPLKVEKGVRLPSGLLDPGVAGVRSALIRPTSRFDTGAWDMRVGRCSAEFHTLGDRGSTPGPATLKVRRLSGWYSMARYANWHSDHDHPSGGARSLMSVGSNPTRVIRNGSKDTSRGPMATTPLLQRGNGGSTPSGTTRRRRGVMVRECAGGMPPL
jgi:hypothetical protein